MASRSISFSGVGTPRSIRSTTHQVWTTLWAMVRARQTRRLLADMDGRMLADIGLSRGDAHMEASRPFWDLKA